MNIEKKGCLNKPNDRRSTNICKLYCLISQIYQREFNNQYADRIFDAIVDKAGLINY